MRHTSATSAGSAIRPNGTVAPTAAMPASSPYQRCAFSVRTRPTVTALTRTLGAHSTASVAVRLMRPALAAP